MKKVLAVLCAVAIATSAFAGTETYSGKEQVAPLPCPAWYADREFNLGIWGTYVFTANEWRDDRYIESDHAWGGGLDAKYFFCRYIGVGFEGWAVDARQAQEKVFIDFSDGISNRSFEHQNNIVGSAMATLTFRYPIPCTRFAPYAWAGGGGIFGGGQRPHFVRVAEPGEGFDIIETHGHSDANAEWVGQFGAGVEVRFTPHIGWINDFSWNVINGPENNFGMVRSGLNFAF